jgi:hypothetical protein
MLLRKNRRHTRMDLRDELISHDRAGDATGRVERPDYFCASGMIAPDFSAAGMFPALTFLQEHSSKLVRTKATRLCQLPSKAANGPVRSRI